MIFCVVDIVVCLVMLMLDFFDVEIVCEVCVEFGCVVCVCVFVM